MNKLACILISRDRLYERRITQSPSIDIFQTPQKGIKSDDTKGIKLARDKNGL